MPKKTKEQILQRKEEIVKACKELYKTMSFKDITIKEIANYTSFTRPSIYNYFETKEEIFLEILKEEYNLFVEELDSIIKSHDKLSKEQVANLISNSLSHRELLLKLMSMNHYDMEANSRMERLVDFKRSYGKSISAMERLIKKFCPDLDATAFIYNFFPFIYGIYPYSVVTEKQRAAMKEAGIDFKYHTIKEMAYNCALKLLEKGEI